MIHFPDHGYCTFPMGHVDQPGFHFCSAKAEDRKPYCAFHCAMCFKPPEAEPQATTAASTIRRVFGGRP